MDRHIMTQKDIRVSQFPNNKDRDGSQNVCLLTNEPPATAASQENFTEFKHHGNFTLHNIL
jgi:hypothetical protein